MDAELNRHSTPSTNPSQEDMTTDEIFDCSYPDCDYKSLWKENVGCHEKGHNPTKEWNIPCEVCPQTFRSLVSFFHHMSSQHTKKLFCPWCLFLGEDLTDFKAHIHAHSGTPPVSSSPSTSINVGSFNAQMLKSSRPQTTKETRKFCCGICFKTFDHESNLSRHKKNAHCSSNSLANSEQKLGAIIDDTQESRKDPEFGEATAAYPDVTSVIPSVDDTQSEGTGDLPTEKLNIDGQTLYGYAACSHKSRRIPNLKAPCLVNTDRSRFGCPMEDCNYRGTSLQYLKNHLLFHTDQRPFACPMEDCEYRGKLLQHLKQHSRRAHRVDLPAQKKAKSTEESLRSGMDCDNQTEVDVSSSNFSMVYACMWCDFIGDSEVVALEHAQQHKTSPF